MESKQLESAICKARRYGLAFHVMQKPLFWMGTLAVPLLAMMIDMFKAKGLLRDDSLIICSVISRVCVWGGGKCAFDAVFVFEENDES